MFCDCCDCDNSNCVYSGTSIPILKNEYPFGG